MFSILSNLDKNHKTIQYLMQLEPCYRHRMLRFLSLLNEIWNYYSNVHIFDYRTFYRIFLCVNTIEPSYMEPSYMKRENTNCPMCQNAPKFQLENIIVISDSFLSLSRSKIGLKIGRNSSVKYTQFRTFNKGRMESKY